MQALEVSQPPVGTSRRRRFGLVAIGAAVVAALLSVSASAADVPLKATPTVLGYDTVEVNWVADPAAQSYTIQYSTSRTSGFKTYTEYDPATKKTPNKVFTGTRGYVGGLSAGKGYYFTVTSYASSDGSGPALKTGDPTPTKAVPAYEYGKVDGVAVSNVGSTFAEVEWVFNEPVLGTPGWRVKATNTKDSSDIVYTDVGSDPIAKVGGAGTETYRFVNGVRVDIGSTKLRKNSTYAIKVASLLPAVTQEVTDPDTGEAQDVELIPAVRVGPYSKTTSVKTSNYPIEPPTDIKMPVQESTRIGLTWTAPDNMPTGYRYQIQYALDASMKKSLVTFGTKFSTAQGTVTGLKANVNYFMRVRVIDANGAAMSALSDVIQTKTPSARGTITGKVNGAPDNNRDVVVVAYATNDRLNTEQNAGNLVEQAEVDASGNYSMRLRPGVYQIYVTYTGDKNYTSLWAKKGSAGMLERSNPRTGQNAEKITISTADTAVTAAPKPVPPVTLGAGGTIKGTVYGIVEKSPRHGGGREALRNVDVAVRSCFSEKVGKFTNRDVIAQAQTNSQGQYTFNGIPDGSYWLRFIYNSSTVGKWDTAYGDNLSDNDGFLPGAMTVRVKNQQVVEALSADGTNSCLTVGDNVSGSPIVQVNPKLAGDADYRKRYAIHIYGTRKVGVTLTTKVNKWIASQYGTSATHAHVDWQFLRGSKIVSSGSSTGAGSGNCDFIRCTPKYKLTKADKGKVITLKVTYYRYGYKTVTKSKKTTKIK